MKAAIMRKGQRGLVKRTSKRPPTTDGSARARAMADVAPSGSTVSACRNRSASPRATRAPAFIWRARPRGLAMKRTEGKRRTTSAVASALPPSTTMTSSWGQRATRSGRSRSRFGASSSAGTTMLSIRDRPAQRVHASQRAKSRFTRGVRRVRL